MRIKYSQTLRQVSKRIGVKRSWSILDLGCGPTCISRFLPPSQKVGIDSSAEKLGIAGKRIADVRVFQGRGEKTHLPVEKFNLVICRNVIDHAQNPGRIIEEVGRVLKPKGYLILSLYVYTPFITFMKTISGFVPQLKNIPHPYAFSTKSSENLVSSKFSVVEKKLIHTGCHANDYGKINEEAGKRSLPEKIGLFFNFKIFRYDWFVKELLFICRKNA